MEGTTEVNELLEPLLRVRSVSALVPKTEGPGHLNVTIFIRPEGQDSEAIDRELKKAQRASTRIAKKRGWKITFIQSHEDLGVIEAVVKKGGEPSGI